MSILREPVSYLRSLIANTLLSDRALTISTLIVAGGFLASKILGLVRERLTGFAFGTGGDLDAFKATLVFSDLLDSVIAGTTIASVFIPIFSRYLIGDQNARREGWRFASAALNNVFLGIALLSALGMIFAEPIVASPLGLAPGFTATQSALTANLLRLVLIATIIYGISGTVTGILHAHNHFLLPSLAPLFNNVGLIAGIIFLVPHFGIYGLAYGAILGSLLHLGIQIPGWIRFGGRSAYFLTLGWREASMHHLAGLFGPRFATTTIVYLTRYIMTNFASRLSVGSVSALSYAYQVWQVPETLIGTAIALAAFPRLAFAVAARNRDQFHKTYHTALISILALAVPATLVAMLFPRQIISLLYRGGQFGDASIDLVSSVLQFYALAIVGESLLELTARIFYAQHDSRTPMFVALVAMFVRVVLMWWLSGIFGAAGLGLAYAVGVMLEGGALYFLARRKLNLPVATAVAQVGQSE